MLLAEFISSSERLREAVPGLAGLVGFVVLPTLMAWGRVLLEMIERDRGGLGRRRHVSSLALARAFGFTLALSFLVFTLLRAASDLRQVQLEAPVLALSLRGAAVGLAIYAIYGVGLSILRKGSRRRAFDRRLRTLR